jgi:hypothetical protein
MNKLFKTCIVLLAFILGAVGSAQAQTEEELAAFARKAQDPLGNVKALMTDNTVAFNGGTDDSTTYGFQLQPVYAIDNDTSWNMILRGIVPVAGIEPSVVVPPIGPEPRPPTGSTWGISDSIVQMFFSPKSDGTWKWGMGPQISLDTSTSERVAGPGWGYGVAGVVFGGVGNFALGSIFMYHWGEDNFETGTIQPIILYNFPKATGWYLGYNNAITYNPNGPSGSKWQVPLGLTTGKTMLLGSGNGLDLSLGAYDLTEVPELGSSWQLKVGLSYFFN